MKLTLNKLIVIIFCVCSTSLVVFSASIVHPNRAEDETGSSNNLQVIFKSLILNSTRSIANIAQESQPTASSVYSEIDNTSIMNINRTASNKSNPANILPRSNATMRTVFRSNQTTTTTRPSRTTTTGSPWRPSRTTTTTGSPWRPSRTTTTGSPWRPSRTTTTGSPSRPSRTTTTESSWRPSRTTTTESWRPTRTTTEYSPTRTTTDRWRRTRTTTDFWYPTRTTKYPTWDDDTSINEVAAIFGAVLVLVFISFVILVWSTRAKPTGIPLDRSTLDKTY